jgi:hypothetical protein
MLNIGVISNTTLLLELIVNPCLKFCEMQLFYFIPRDVFQYENLQRDEKLKGKRDKKGVTPAEC